ncbi:hypothetical protein [Novosphingobium sp.]|uniref:hypothetical protein n=1 Tax=Novosphingobium sp. TaxID=1874826 RepID=UPI0026134251|nr:hypothetical protein [Novosphingobium sp.]
MDDNADAPASGEHVRTITDEDAKAIAAALLTEATKQVLMATGRGVWSTIKALVFPLLIGVVIWWAATKGTQIEVPVHIKQVR